MSSCSMPVSLRRALRAMRRSEVAAVPGVDNKEQAGRPPVPCENPAEAGAGAGLIVQKIFRCRFPERRDIIGPQAHDVTYFE
jgi:hypothetical protein